MELAVLMIHLIHCPSSKTNNVAATRFFLRFKNRFALARPIVGLNPGAFR